MLDGQNLITAVQQIETRAGTGKTFRIIKLKYLIKQVQNQKILNGSQALSTIGSIKGGGRYNPPQKLEALYLADTPDNALKEVELSRQTFPAAQQSPSPPHILLTIEYQCCQILDLTDTNIQTCLQTSIDELTKPWRTWNADKKIAPTQYLGATIHQNTRIEALKVPSAKLTNAYNLVIFPDRLKNNSYARVFDHDGLINATLP